MRHFRLKPLTRLVSLSLLSLTAPALGLAQTVDLGTIGASTAAGAYRPAEELKGTASAIAPSQASLQATQPQSIITREFIDLSVAPTAEYSRVVSVAPSMAGNAANGPGLGETKMTLRGFQDDQYNITFDGIPWGDTNNPAHHSTSFFPATILGGTIIERGPGKASDMGYATFGGSVNLFSKKASETEQSSVYGTLGTWNTRLIGASWESGRMANQGDATLQLNYQHLQSDGYLSYSPIKSDNFTAKYERPVGDATLLTFFTSVNKVHYQQPDSNKGATLTQIAAYGRNFQLDNNPSSMNYWGYNYTDKDTDFEYLRLRSALGDGWSVDNNAYTYAYQNKTITTTDPLWTGTVGGGTDPRVTKTGNPVTTNTGNIPGIDKLNQYRVYGDIFKATRKMDNGDLRVGAWLETSRTDRHQYSLDLTTGAYNRTESTNASFLPGTNRYIDSVKFDQRSRVDNIQPFAEFEWKATQTTTVTPGYKYARITRSTDSPVASGTRLLNDSQKLTYNAGLPFLTVNEKLAPNLAAYGQFAKGMQIPDLNTFYIADPSKNSTDPQKTTNYQLGLVGKNDRLTWDVAAYRIDFNNKLVSNNLSGTQAAFVNIGGARYSGFEAQGTYVLGGGFAAYANGSINRAIANDTGKQISGAPETTAALGALYDNGSLSGSLIYKRTGAVYQKDYTTNQAYYDYYRVASYGTVDLGMAYRFTGLGTLGKSLKLQLNVFNLTNSNKVTSISPSSSSAVGSAKDAYIYQTPRSVQVSAKLDF